MAKKKEDQVETKDEKNANALEITQQMITKKYGEGVISLLGKHEDLKIDVVPTGCLALDASLGIGGLARSRLHEIYGPNSSGKSTLALSVCMQALKRNLNVAYVDAEHSMDPKLVRSMGNAVGVSADKMYLVQAFTGDDNLAIAEALMKTGMMDILVIDSVSALLPRSMSEGDIGDNYIGLLARLMSKACLKLTPIANYSKTMLIFINQIRHNIGKWGDDRVPTGGEALSYYSTNRIKVEGGESQKSRIINDEGLVIGHKCAFEIVKNKLSVPWRTASINLIYGVGYDYVHELFDLGVDLGLIEKSGSWFIYKGEKVQGEKSMVDIIRENESWHKELDTEIKNRLGLKNE
jgi:recombination protein RecA